MNIKQIWNAGLFIIGFLTFYIGIHTSSIIYHYFPSDKIRRWSINGSSKVLFRLIDYIWKSQIKVHPVHPLHTLLPLNQVTIINANHVHNLDQLVMFALLKKPEEITSVSTLKNTGPFDQKILTLIDAITLGPNFLTEAKGRFDRFKKRKYNTFVLNFFEGVALNHYEGPLEMTWTNRPKYVMFQLLCKQFPGKKFYDLDLVYLHKNSRLNPKDPYFIWKLLHPDTYIYVNVKICTFPRDDPDQFLDELYLQKNQRVQTILSNASLNSEYKTSG